MYTTRQSLLDAKRQNQESAWEDFRTTYAPLVRLIAAKRRLTDLETDELLQDVCVTVFQRDALNKYDPAQGRFRTYLGRIIYNCANDIIRKRNAAAAAAHFTTRSFNHLPQDNPDPTQLELQQDWENFLMEKAMAEVRATLRRRNVPRLRVPRPPETPRQGGRRAAGHLRAECLSRQQPHHPAHQGGHRTPAQGV